MIAFPFAKINLGLYVERLRPDGYRDIRSVMLPVPLCDILEVVEAPDLAAGQVVMTYSGIHVPGDPANDLCQRAVRSVAIDRPLPGLRIHVHKCIPTGAGLGGGSSDGAHTLLLLDRLFGLGMGHERLAGLAAGLGSDCAFFLRNEPQLAEGRGERLTPLAASVAGWWLVLVNPGIHVGTPEVYAHTPVQAEEVDLPALMQAGPRAWAEQLHNRMEPYVFSTYPEVGRLKRTMIDAGATYAAMSGSGSTVFGLFKSRPELTGLPVAPLLVTRL
jgi:4-diphosphocytidyl-2-C-methyl-D-erythritol kinase